MSTWSWRSIRPVLLLVTVLVASCGGDGDAIVTGGDGAAEVAPDDDRPGPGPTIVGPIDRRPGCGDHGGVGSDVAAASTSSIAAYAPVDTPANSTLQGDDLPAFTTPIGNIACSVDEIWGASCWLSDKDWETEMPDGEFCDVSDWGNVIAVDDGGVTWLCYTEFPWDPTAPPLAYGDAVVAAGFSCWSRESGLTCANAVGDGFTVARVTVDVFSG